MGKVRIKHDFYGEVKRLRRGDYRLKKGDHVVMHTCLEHDNPKYFGKVWTCKSDEYERGNGEYGVVFLEGFSGSFATEFLQYINPEYLGQFEELSK